VYTPNPNAFGVDTFTFTATDLTGTSVPATVTIEIAGVNDPPKALAQTITTNEDTPVAINLTGTDPDGDALGFSIGTPPAKGTLSVIAGQLTYTPYPDVNGNDSFTFHATDGITRSAPATVSIFILSVNDRPVATSQTVDVSKNQPRTFQLDVIDVDGDPLAVTIISPPFHGSLSAISGTQVTYTPATGFSGSDSFRYRANDGHVDSGTATVTLNVQSAASGDLQFDATGVDVNEKAGTVTLTVTRSGGSHGAVSVHYATADGTALQPSDYTTTSGTLTWATGDTSSRTIVVPIVDDPALEGDEAFTVTLSSPTGGAAIGTPALSVVTILDDASLILRDGFESGDVSQWLGGFAP